MGDRAPDHLEELSSPEGLRQVVEGLKLNGGDGRLNVRLSGEENHRDVEGPRAQLAKELGAGSARKIDVRDNDIESLELEALESLLCRTDYDGIMSVAREDARHRRANVWGVVYDEHPGRVLGQYPTLVQGAFSARRTHTFRFPEGCGCRSHVTSSKDGRRPQFS